MILILTIVSKYRQNSNLKNVYVVYFSMMFNESHNLSKPQINESHNLSKPQIDESHNLSKPQ